MFLAGAKNKRERISHPANTALTPDENGSHPRRERLSRPSCIGFAMCKNDSDRVQTPSLTKNGNMLINCFDVGKTKENCFFFWFFARFALPLQGFSKKHQTLQ